MIEPMGVRKYLTLQNLLLLCLLVLLFAPILRFMETGNVYIGDDIIESALLNKNGFLSSWVLIDDSFVHPRIQYNGPHFIIVSSLLGTGLLGTTLLSILLGIITVYLFYLLLDNSLKNKYLIFAIVLVFIVSPAFINSFLRLTVSSTLIIFYLLSFLSFRREGWFWRSLNILLIVIISMYGIEYLLLFFLLLLVYSAMLKQKILFFLEVLTASIFILILYVFGLPLHFSILREFLGSAERLMAFVSNFGGQFGFSVISLLLCFFGLHFSWKSKNRYYSAFILFIFAFFYSYFRTDVYNLFLTIGIAIFAGIALYRIMILDWKLLIIRNATFFVIFLSFLFVVLSTSGEIAASSPDNNLIMAVQNLGNLSEGVDTVLSDSDLSAYIRYYSEDRVLTDKKSEYIGYESEIINDTNLLFQGRNLDYAFELFSKYNITYILLSREMIEGKIWNKPEEGLLFLLNNEEVFDLKYYKLGYMIYEIVYQDEN